MFSRFLKPRWQHANPDIRLKAIDHLSPDSDAEILARLTRGDASALVRAAAAGRLIDLALLGEVQRRDEAPSVREAASLRIMALLAGTTEDAPNSETRLRLIRLTSNPQVLAFVAQNSPDDNSRLAAIRQLDDQPLLFQLAIDGHSETLRLAAAEQLTELSLLKRLSREGRDKRVTRQAREHAKALQDQQQQAEAEAAKVINLADRLEQHARRTVDALYGPRLAQLEQQWRERIANSVPPELVSRIQQALQQCRDQLSSLQEQTRLQALATTAKAEREAAAHTLYQLLGQASPQTWEQQLGELRSAVATQQRRWQSAHEQSPANEDEQAAFADLISACEKMISLAGAILEAGDDAVALAELAAQWPAEYARPQALQKLQQTPDQTIHPARKEKADNAHRGLLVALQRELRQGNLRHANKLWHKAQQIIEDNGDRGLGSALEKLSARREELQDWHRFAAEPKKVALCEAMEALQGSDMDAPQLGSAIQALHDEWRELMSSDQDEDQALWERFKAASDLAYLPCQAYYAEQDTIKKENLEKRSALIEQLRGFLDKQNWDQADWHGIWQIRQQAPKDWKALQPVRFTDARELQRHFSQILGGLDEKLNQYVESASAARQALLEQACQLLEHEDPDQAAREAQQLQKQWRSTPWLPPAQHRSLQKAFGKVMDKVFAARQREQQARKAQQSENLERFNTLASQLQQALGLPFSEAAVNQLKEILDQFNASLVVNLPSAATRQAQQLKRRANEKLAQLSTWKRWQSIQQQLDQSAGDQEVDEPSLTLAVAFEALAGVPSPEAERQRRLEWQLQQLPTAMKQQGFNALEEMQRLLEKHDAPLPAAIQLRLFQALAVLEPGNE